MKFLIERPDYPSDEKPCKYSIEELYFNNDKVESKDWFVYIDSLEKLLEINKECQSIELKDCSWIENMKVIVMTG